MPDLKDVLQRIRATKQEKRKIGESFRDVLAQSKPYQDVLDEMKDLKAKKARLETEIRQEFTKELEKAEKLAADLKTDTQLLSDMALTKFMKGETIDIVDENDVKYEPVFKVSFKKTF
jgi:DNA repair ATPase RecN